MVENEHSSIEPGYIYICYQGVGKSSTVNENSGFIDLESSNFRLEDGFRPDDWYKYYAQVAFDLATQGYSVFTASHDVVREELARLRDAYHPEVKIAIIYPNPELRDAWVDRLQARYDANPTKKNEAALGNAKDRLPENVKEMEDDAYAYGFGIIKIDSTNYKLIDKLPLQDPNVAISVAINETDFNPESDEIGLTIHKGVKQDGGEWI